MNEESELERKLKMVTVAKKAAIAEVNFELAANLRDEEKSLLKQVEELKNLKKE
jgi:protein-arginine kinase activator protein McsA